MTMINYGKHQRNNEWSIPISEIDFPNFSATRVIDTPYQNKFIKSNRVVFVLGQANCGQKRDGPQLAPSLIINSRFLKIIRTLGWEPTVEKVQQIFVPTPSNMKTNLHMPFSVMATNDHLWRTIAKIQSSDALSVMVGGDHALSMGSIRGSYEKYPDLRILWVDAHSDINTPETSSSGNMHGMPLAFLMGLTKNIPGLENERYKCLTPDHLGYLGLRSVDSGEKKILSKYGIANVAFGIPELNKYGIIELVKRVLEKINPGNKYPLHLSFDVDGMDPMDTPSTGTPVEKGIRLPEALEMIRYVRNTGCLVSMDVVEVNPLLGTKNEANVTVGNARQVITTALGHNLYQESKI